MVASTHTVAPVSAGSPATRSASVRPAPGTGIASTDPFPTIEGISAPDAVQPRQTGQDGGFGTFGETTGYDTAGWPGQGDGTAGNGAATAVGPFAALLAANALGDATADQPASRLSRPRGLASEAVGLYDRAVRTIAGQQRADLVGRTLDRAL